VNAAHNGDSAWKGVSIEATAERPVFGIRPPKYITSEIVEFVQAKLGLLPSSTHMS